MAERKAPAFRRDVEGMRALAILVVVAFHCRVSLFRGGFVGVDVFFVLSGFLITGLLAREVQNNGRISMVEFYARRARRLLPASAVMILVTTIVGLRLFTPSELDWLARAARASALYMANVFFAINAQDYFGPNVRSNPLLHMWSLAVEEQFYFVWPLLMLVCLQLLRSKRTLFALLGIVSVASLAFGVWSSAHNPTAAFYELPSRAWEFGIGALAALLPGRYLPRTGWIPAAGFAAVATSFFAISEASQFPGFVALLPALGTGLVLLRSPEAPLVLHQHLLAAPPLQRIGKLSYSWYLWHWPFLVVAAALFPEIGVWGRCAAALLALAASALTFSLVENPVRFNRYLVRRPVFTVAAALATMAICVLVAKGTSRYAHRLATEPRFIAMTQASEDIADMDRLRCVTQRGQALKACTYGDSSSPVRVVLLGDSHAIQWFDALNRISVQRHWQLRTYLKSGCPAVDIQLRSEGAGFRRECDSWRQAALAAVNGERPAYVFIGTATRYLAAKSLAADQSVPLPQWQQGFRHTLSQLVAGGTQVFVFRDTPNPPFDVPTCLARAARSATDPEAACGFQSGPAVRASAFEAEKAAGTGLIGVHFIDLTDQFCTNGSCTPVKDGLIVYRDDDHLTGRFAYSLINPLDDAISRVLGSSSAQLH